MVAERLHTDFWMDSIRKENDFDCGCPLPKAKDEAEYVLRELITNFSTTY